MALTGRPDGPPMVAPGRPATFVRETLAELGSTDRVLGQRAAHAGLWRNAPWSCGGAFRILPTRDGWLGLSLPRPSDIELVPALVEAEIRGSDPWPTIAAWCRNAPVHEAESRLRLLGLAGGAVPVAGSLPRDRPGVVHTVLGRRIPRERPVVVDLTSLWAGPLCAQLLGRRGAHVVKVESVGRPDGARLGSRSLFGLLHSGHDQVLLDFDVDRGRLAELVRSADLVLESSRPRALRQLGIIAEDVVAGGTSWLSITARGRASDSIGFGDDVAACAGLVTSGDEPLPVGDALADPLTGVAAAVVAVDALASTEARLIDVSMLHVAASVNGPMPAHEVVRHDDRWWLEDDTGRWPVEDPRP